MGDKLRIINFDNGTLNYSKIGYIFPIGMVFKLHNYKSSRTDFHSGLESHAYSIKIMDNSRTKTILIINDKGIITRID